MPTIRISDKVYKDLSTRGNLQDTFDKVIGRLLKNEKKKEAVVAK